MVTLKDKIILITGASSGIGYATAEQFAAAGAKLILVARRLDKLTALAKKLTDQYQTTCLTLQLDIQDKQNVSDVLANLPLGWREIAILVNNAGLALGSDKIQDGSLENWDKMIDTNIRGLLYVTHAVLPGMVARNTGHIINIGSVAGHECYQGGNIYCATKHAVKALSKSLRIDLLGLGIRVTELDPGAVNTEFSTVRWQDKSRADEFYQGFAPLVSQDIADAALFCATRPAHVNIAEMVIYPTAQASPNHLHKKAAQVKNLFE
jgi:3-hydroxy acid dehydrogenase/malonic semialdehyde reductase